MHLCAQAAAAEGAAAAVAKRPAPQALPIRQYLVRRRGPGTARARRTAAAAAAAAATRPGGAR